MSITCDKCGTEKSLVFWYNQEAYNDEGKATLAKRYLCRQCAAELDRSIRPTLDGIEPEALRMGMLSELGR